MTATARSCPTCGATLPARSTGRPATYCSTPCRQGAHRAKQRARTSAERAAAARDRMARDLEEALGTLHKAARLLAEPRRAAEVEVGRTVAEGGQGWHAEIPSGWENDLAELADVAARRARTVVEQLREHARAAVEHRQAVPVAGIRRAPAARSSDDETPGGPSSTGPAPSVANTAAEDLATKPGPVDDTGAEAEVDRDALFDAIEDVVYELGDTRAHLLPADVAEALAAPVDELTDVLATATGNGPLDALLTAARTLLTAAAPVVDHEGVPERARAALTALADAVGPPGFVAAATARPA